MRARARLALPRTACPVAVDGFSSGKEREKKPAKKRSLAIECRAKKREEGLRDRTNARVTSHIEAGEKKTRRTCTLPRRCEAER